MSKNINVRAQAIMRERIRSARECLGYTAYPDEGRVKDPSEVLGFALYETSQLAAFYQEWFDENGIRLKGVSKVVLQSPHKAHGWNSLLVKKPLHGRKCDECGSKIEKGEDFYLRAHESETWTKNICSACHKGLEARGDLNFKCELSEEASNDDTA